MASTSNSTSRVVRRKRPMAPFFRYYPYATGTPSSEKGDMKEEVVRLGVELSLYVTESMFLLCDDIRTLLWFCYKLWRYTIPHLDPVSERLLRVIYHVYSKDIKPKNGVYKADANSSQFQLLSTTWNDFCDGIIVLHRLVKVLRTKDCSFDDRLLFSAIEKYKQVLKRLEDKLRSAKDVSESNGFAREMIESNISHMWKSLFDEESVDLWKSLFDGHEEVGEEPAIVIKNRILPDLFQHINGTTWHSDIQKLPVYSPYIQPLYSPFILGKDLAKHELKEEVVRLGVELSLHVAESVFSLCDDIRSMLRFCYKLWRDAERDLSPKSPVMKSMLGVLFYVNSEYIKPKNGVSQNGGESSQWRLIRVTLESFGDGFRDMDLLVSILRREGSYLDGREFTSSIEQTLKKVEETLRCAKDVSEANGFRRDAMESNILDLWKSIFDKQTEEAWSCKAMRIGVYYDLFHPLLKEFSQQNIETRASC